MEICHHCESADHCYRLGAGPTAGLLPATASADDRGGRDNTVTVSGEDLAHHTGHRARMGRVIADKIKPTGLGVVAKPKPSS